MGRSEFEWPWWEGNRPEEDQAASAPCVSQQHVQATPSNCYEAVSPTLWPCQEEYDTKVSSGVTCWDLFFEAEPVAVDPVAVD